MVKRKQNGKILHSKAYEDDSLKEKDSKVEKVEDGEEPEEEEIFDGFLDNEEDEAEEFEEKEPKAKKQKAQLSAHDIQVARETAELFKSNIFKLQIDELIKELKFKDHYVARAEQALRALHGIISKIPPLENLTLSQAEHHFNSKKVVIPFPDPKPSKLNYSFSYLPPEDISLVGSFGLKTGTFLKEGMSIDLALTMPRTLLQPKDYLNYRALYKRAFYVAYLVENLISLTKKNHLPVKMTYEFLNDDVLCPVIRLESIETSNPEDLCFSKTRFSIKLLVGFPCGFFDSKKLLPDRNCIRVQHESSNLPPTPIYNSSILSLSSYDHYLKYLYAAKKSTEFFKDACILGKLWSQHRGFGSLFNSGGFGHFEFSVIMAALLNGGGISGNKILLHGFSSYQLFKGTIKYLATMDLRSGYLSFSSKIEGAPTSKYHADTDFNVPTVFDRNIRLNVLWKMTSSSYQLLQKQAAETLMLLNDVVKDRFDPILLQKSDQDQMKFDMVLDIEAPEEMYEGFGPLEKISFITFENFFKHKLYLILHSALAHRVSLISIKNIKNKGNFPLSKRKPYDSRHKFTIGLQLNPEECEKLVTKGPANDNEELGTKFKIFWGNMASLRRFKDGSIQHCVVWTVKDNEPIIISIVKYVLDLHLCPNSSLYLLTNSSILRNRLPTPLLPAALSHVTSLNSFVTLKGSFENLSKIISSLELPLKVKSLLPVSVSMRYSSLLQPVPFASSNPDFWNDAVLQFEISSKWPDELTALEDIKSAFLLKIAHFLLKDTVYRPFLTKDESIPFNEKATALNVLTPEGFGFKIRVLTERDEILYLRAIDNAQKQRALAQEIYLRFYRTYIGSIKHTRTVSLLAHHFAFFSPCVRIFKQWLDSQLLLHHFSDELVELIALKPFVDPAPYSTPHSPENGFLQILNFLSRWNWKEEPLILDLARRNEEFEEVLSDKLSDRLTIQAHRVIELNFEKIRKNDPSGIKTQLFVGSKDDPSGILWSNDLSLPIATRLTALARLAMHLIGEKGFNESTIDLVFTPALKDYDFVITTKGSDLVASSGILPANSFKNLIGVLSSFPGDISTTYDLVQGYVNDLNRKFGNLILFSTKKFSSLAKDSSNVVTGVFVPTSSSEKKLKPTLGINVKPFTSGGDDDVIINKDAIMSQIKLLGDDLIESLEIL
ncbi:uncharacterized protein PRCAT00000200001 [Priceomyces carsonii]|uniref:uncharacterized protein n=1 Tax=Priceomyces carsonii TaxID=28549 RepID=UPI002EDB170B|nr:unnamed protein product [Priceomyces carsonii]